MSGDPGRFPIFMHFHLPCKLTNEIIIMYIFLLYYISVNGISGVLYINEPVNLATRKMIFSLVIIATSTQHCLSQCENQVVYSTCALLQGDYFPGCWRRVKNILITPSVNGSPTLYNR